MFIINTKMSKTKKMQKTFVMNKSNKSNKSTKHINSSKSSKHINLPSIDDFRMSTFFENMIDEYKEQKKSINKITDKDILNYMNKMNHNDKQLLIKQMKEIKEYTNLPNKINFQPLTIELLRKKYWNAKTKKWKIIKSYYDGGYPNDYRFGPSNITNIQDRNNRKKVFDDEFIPNGDLIETNWWNTDTDKRYKDWLQSKKLGPYKYEDYDYKNKKKLFFIDGKRKYSGEETFDDDEGMQICQSNYVSTNCAGGPSWVEVDEKDYV